MKHRKVTTINIFFPDGGAKVELGAHWVHGSDRNPLYDLAKKHDLVTYKQEFTNDSKGGNKNGNSTEIFTLLLCCKMNTSYCTVRVHLHPHLSLSGQQIIVPLALTSRMDGFKSSTMALST